MTEINISKLVDHTLKGDYHKTIGEEKEFKNSLYKLGSAYKYTNKFTKEQRRFVKYVLPSFKEPKIYEIMKLYDLKSDLIIYIYEKKFYESDDEDCNKYVEL